MLIGFERAEIRGRPPLGTLSPNRNRNMQGKLKSGMEENEFNCEVQSAKALTYDITISQYHW